MINAYRVLFCSSCSSVKCLQLDFPHLHAWRELERRDWGTRTTFSSGAIVGLDLLVLNDLTYDLGDHDLSLNTNAVLL